MNNIALIDYGLGNVRSISNALESLGARPLLTSAPPVIMAASGLVLPGVGAFPAGMANLAKRQLVEVIKDYARSGRPVLAICLGMQLLFDESEEFGHSPGLGLVAGRVVRLPVSPGCADKLPHVSWNEVLEPAPDRWRDSLLATTPSGAHVYFVHSYCGQPVDRRDILAETSYGGNRFCSAVHRGNVHGFQFHPEKSGPVGLAILRKFAQTCS